MPLRFGVLGAAKIAIEKVIPAMQRGQHTKVVAIGSRDLGRARATADALGIARAYGSYDEVLADPDVDAVYIPLPNHLHVDWTIRAADAGKHVLCEKPIGLSEADAARLLPVRARTGVQMQEAFMVAAHPQWRLARELAQSGRLGDLRAMVGWFSYANMDPANIRNMAACGGGALLDIGCYFVMTSRFVFAREPQRVVATMERDPVFGVDRLTSMILDFGNATFTGTCGTQTAPFQRVHLAGSRGRLELEIPFNAPAGESTWVSIEGVPGIMNGGRERLATEPCDQYTLQGDQFSDAVSRGHAAPYPLEESMANMRVIDALFRSADTGAWVSMSGGTR